jgi:hypothetical protein
MSSLAIRNTLDTSASHRKEGLGSAWKMGEAEEVRKRTLASSHARFGRSSNGTILVALQTPSIEYPR